MSNTTERLQIKDFENPMLIIDQKDAMLISSWLSGEKISRVTAKDYLTLSFIRKQPKIISFLQNLFWEIGEEMPIRVVSVEWEHENNELMVCCKSAEDQKIKLSFTNFMSEIKYIQVKTEYEEFLGRKDVIWKGNLIKWKIFWNAYHLKKGNSVLFRIEQTINTENHYYPNRVIINSERFNIYIDTALLLDIVKLIDLKTVSIEGKTVETNSYVLHEMLKSRLPEGEMKIEFPNNNLDVDFEIIISNKGELRKAIYKRRSSEEETLLLEWNDKKDASGIESIKSINLVEEIFECEGRKKIQRLCSKIRSEFKLSVYCWYKRSHLSVVIYCGKIIECTVILDDEMYSVQSIDEWKYTNHNCRFSKGNSELSIKIPDDFPGVLPSYSEVIQSVRKVLGFMEGYNRQ